MDTAWKSYEELVTRGRSDDEDKRAAALTKGFREVSRRLGRVTFLYGMLRRMMENELPLR